LHPGSYSWTFVPVAGDSFTELAIENAT